MGGSNSTLKSANNVFDKDLTKIESLINTIITKNNEFVDSNYNFLNDNVCEKYTMVIESKLSKYLKIHLHDLASNIYFVPKKNEQITVKNETITKKDLCNIITSHYVRTLKILSLVREIYDIENGGDYSIAGILYRNMDNVEGMFQVSYCGMNQEPLNGGDRVDFNKLKGLKRFTEEILTEEESRTFVQHLKQLFGNINKRKIAELVCKDTLVSLETYRSIYDGIPIQFKCQTGGGNHLMFYVAKDKPIISYDLCYDKQKMMIPYDKKIKDLFQKFKSDYNANLDRLTSLIYKLIIFCNKSNQYKLKDLTHDQLTSIEIELKKVVIVFFIQSMVNYYKIFNYIKNNKHLKK
jgi:hypothetical protein